MLAARGDVVVVRSGLTTARLRLKRAAAGAPRAAVSVAPRLALRRAPARCLAPPAGRPRACLYRLDPRPPLRITTPVGGTARVVMAPASTAGGRRHPASSPRLSVFVMAGRNDIGLDDLAYASGMCSAWVNCPVRPGAYRVTVTLPAGARPRVHAVITRIVLGRGSDIAGVAAAPR